MIPSSDIVSKAVLEALFLNDEPRSWRLRNVLQVTPVHRTAYRARLSIQFLLSPRFVEEVWGALALQFSNPPQMPGDGEEFEIVLPIEYFPKYVLLDFSLLDQSGKPMALLTSGETKNLSFGIVRAAMETIDKRVPDGKQDAVDFLNTAEDIVRCLVATGQREIPAALRELATLPQNDPSMFNFTVGMLDFFEDGLRQFMGRSAFPQELRDMCRGGILGFYRRIESLHPGLRRQLGGREGFHSPMLNPLTLVVDFLKTYPPTDDTDLTTRLRHFLSSCQLFIAAIDKIADDQWRFTPIFFVLSRFAQSYVAYARIKVPVGRDFIVKIDHLIPAEGSSWQHPILSFRNRNHQWYPFRLGDSRSLHIEVVCEHPLELEQVPEGTRVTADGTPISLTDLFGRAGYNTRYEQHFYTNKTAEQLGNMLQASGQQHEPRAMFDLRLGIKFTVDFTTRFSHRLITIVVFAAAVALVVVYDPVQLRTGRTQLLPLVPILFALFGALGSLKPQENLVALRMRKYKITVLSLGAAMSLYFLIGLIAPGLVNYVRQCLGLIGSGGE